MIKQDQFQGSEDVTGYGYEYRYEPETGLLRIGCQEHTIPEWREQGEALINQHLGWVCGAVNCGMCRQAEAQRALARRELPKLLDAIEASERVTPDLIQYNTSRPETILPADVYDTLELSALAFGGIGARTYFEDLEDYAFDAPRCALGHAYWAAGNAAVFSDEALAKPLLAAFEWPEDEKHSVWGDQINDQAIYAINERKGKGECSPDRVTFYEWAGELNVRRGE